MANHYVPALRQRFLEDMRIKGLQPKTQTMYLRAMRDFTRYLGHSPDSATSESLIQNSLNAFKPLRDGV